MSRITFTTKSEGDATVRGPERAMAGVTCSRFLTGHLDLSDTRLAQLFPVGHYIHQHALDRDFPAGLVFADRLRTLLSVGDCSLTLPDGRADPSWIIGLNTAVLYGNDVVRFLARLHGQCEVHGWVAGSNRAWLADIIEEGRRLDILRADMGWEAVIALLRNSAEGDVVTYYSVTDSFPNPHLAGIVYNEETDNDPWAEFDEMPEGERWDRCMNAIRGGGLEWSPDNWASVRFGEGLSVIDIQRVRWPDVELVA